MSANHTCAGWRNGNAGNCRIADRQSGLGNNAARLILGRNSGRSQLRTRGSQPLAVNSGNASDTRIPRDAFRGIAAGIVAISGGRRILLCPTGCDRRVGRRDGQRNDVIRTGKETAATGLRNEYRGCR